MSISNLKQAAKEKLKGNWGIAIIAMIVMGLITGAPSTISQFLLEKGSYFGSIISLASIALIPVSIGYNKIHMDLSAHKNPEIDDIFYGFKDGRYANSLITLLVMNLFIVLWMFLLIIPGIIKSLAYSMTPFILADPDFEGLSPTEAITKSREMMNGHKGDLFILMLSFIGWMILSIITFGILLFYVAPYIQQATAEFYYEVKGVRPESVSTSDTVDDETSKSEDPFFY